MTTVHVTYHAPKDDSKVVEMGGHTFFDGKATEIEANAENAHLIENLKTNPHFETRGAEGGPTGHPADATAGETQPGPDEEDADEATAPHKAHRRR